MISGFSELKGKKPDSLLRNMVPKSTGIMSVLKSFGVTNSVLAQRTSDTFRTPGNPQAGVNSFLSGPKMENNLHSKQVHFKAHILR